MSAARSRRHEGGARHIPINGPEPDADVDGPRDEPLPNASELAAARAEAMLKASAAPAQEANGAQANGAQADDDVALLPAAELMARLKRVKADFANYQRRMEAERRKWTAAGRREALLSLLPALDQLEITAASADRHEDYDGLVAALGMVRNEMNRFLKSSGVERMESVGNVFDPEIHEALFNKPTDEAEPGVVLEEMRPGYTIGDKVLRPSQVVVSAAPKAPAEDAADEAPAADGPADEEA